MPEAPLTEPEEQDVDDESDWDETVPLQSYNITSFGADYDVEGLVRRLQRGDLLIPEFQREYVWGQKEASRFVESLLLGLPVPGVFLARERDTNRLLVIDGQQRLKSLQFYYEGFFNPKQDDKTKKVFQLSRVQPKFDGKTYEMLADEDRVKLNDSIIHATIVKQDEPEGDDTSIYHIFERLNYGGRRLYPQEIRAAVYHGPLMDMILSLNSHLPWRAIYGKQHTRLKDQELILRYLALRHRASDYKAPMAEFLNQFAAKYRSPDHAFIKNSQEEFAAALDAIHEAVGDKAFRPERALNAAVFDSVMVAVTARQGAGPLGPTNLQKAYTSLMADKKYVAAVSKATSNERTVEERLAKAKQYISGA